MPLVVLDPGHGFPDVGALNPHGPPHEKDVALAIARVVARELTGLGVETMLTRVDDTFVELSDRAAIANLAGADLFVSVHCNGHTSQARGIETLYHPVSEDGKRAAQFVQDAMLDSFPRSVDRGLKARRDLTVLNRTEMPAVLAECEFITNREQARLLATPLVQRGFGEAIAEGVRKYLGVVSAPQPEAPPVYRVIVDGRQVSANAVMPNLLTHVSAAIEDGRARITLERV